MKRQDSLRASSSPRDNYSAEKLHATTIGCMSCIIKLVCKSHNPRKLLTFGSGKKQMKNASMLSTSPSATKVRQETAMSKGREPRNTRHGRSLSCDLLRSPTLPAEIRHLNSLNYSENMHTSPALVPKLMDLESLDESAQRISTPRATTAVHKPESMAEKRLRLLASLQKCDEDLKSLKKIIEAVQSAELQRTPQKPPEPVVSESTASSVREKTITTINEKTLLKLTGDQQQQRSPSSVSVLDELSRSPLSLASYSTRRHSSGQVLPQQKQPLLKKLGEDQMNGTYVSERIANEFVRRNGKSELSNAWNSKAMIDSVEEVCRDIARGQKGEIGRIGVAVQDTICRDLIEEIVRELGRCRFNSCNRKLCF